MRLLLWISFFIMVLYYATLNDYALNYGYMKLKFDITPEGFAGFNAIGTVGYIVCIFGLLPLLRQGLERHKSIPIIMHLLQLDKKKEWF